MNSDNNNGTIFVSADPSFEWQRKAPKKKGFPKALKAVLALILVAAVSVGSAAGYMYLKGGNNAPKQTTATGVVYRQIQQVSATSATATAEVKTAGDLTIPEIYANCVKSAVIFTVSIPQTGSGYYFGFYGQQQGKTYSTAYGSGVIMTSDGYILTNAHVVEGAEKIKITLYDGREFDATLVGSDEKTDVAVVKIDATGLPAATFGDSSTVMVGEEAYVIGNPLGEELAFSLTCGHISAVEREIDIQGTYMGLMQCDAAVSPGNSGGPLINAQGLVIGLVNAKISSSDTEGIGFAVPINKALSIATSLIDYGYVANRPWLGITVNSVTAEQAVVYNLPEGITVVEVSEGSCAEKGGMKVGDKITHFDGVAVSTAGQLNFQKEKHSIGDTVTVTVERDGQTLVLTVVLTA